MKKVIVLIAVAATLTACAAPSNYPKADLQACRTEARASDEAQVRPGLAPITGITPEYNSRQYAKAQDKIFTECMAARGHLIVK